MTKKLKFLIIHCTATPEGREVTKEEIISWHCDPKPKGRGWRKPGYSDLINLKGELINITPFDQDDDKDGWELTNGVLGINDMSHHIVYAGGMDKQNKKAKDTRTNAQIEALITYVRYAVLRWPDILIAGHNQFASKACPSFDVPCFLDSIDIPERNIYRGKK